MSENIYISIELHKFVSDGRMLVQVARTRSGGHMTFRVYENPTPATVARIGRFYRHFSRQHYSGRTITGITRTDDRNIWYMDASIGL